MPQMGEQRTVGAETRVWNGGGWVRPTPGSVENEPDTWIGGAARHLVEQEPAARNALLGGAALLTGGMGAPIAAATQAVSPLVGRGMKMLSQFLNTGHADRPSGGELAGDVAEGAVQGYGGAALGAAGRGLGRAGTAIADAASEYGPLGKLLMKGSHLKTSVMTSKPVSGAIEALGQKLSPSGFYDMAMDGIRSMKPGIEEVRPPQRVYRPKVKTSEYGMPSEGPIAAQPSDAAPRMKQGYTMPETPAAAAPEARLAGKAPTVNESIDDALNQLRGEPSVTHTGKVGNTPQLPHGARAGDIYGETPAPAAEAPPSSAMPKDPGAEQYNIDRNAPYGGGQMLSGPLPTELQDPALEGLHSALGDHVYNSELGMALPRVPEFTFEGGNLAHPEVPGLTVDTSEFARPKTPDFSFEGGNTAHPEVPGLTVDTSEFARPGAATAAKPTDLAAGGGDIPYEHSPADLIGPQAETPFDDALNELRMQGEAEGWPEYNPKWTSYIKAADRGRYNGIPNEGN